MTPIVLAPLAVLLVLAAAVGFLPSANAADSDGDDEGRSSGGDGGMPANPAGAGAGGPGTSGGAQRGGGGLGGVLGVTVDTVMDLGSAEDPVRVSTLKASREEYQRQAKAVAAAMRTLRGDINTAKGKPSGTQKVGAWLAEVLKDLGYSAEDRRAIVSDLDLRRKRKSDGVWVWRDYPWAKTWQAADEAARRATNKVQANKSRQAAGIVAAHRETDVFGDRASGPLAGAYAAAERAWLDHQSLITSGAT